MRDDVAAAELPQNPHNCPIEVLTKLLDVVPGQGLSTVEVGARRSVFGPNVLQQQQRVSILGVLLNQIKSPVVLLLVAATGLAFSLREWIDGAAILTVLVINTLIGFTTEMRAVRSMEALGRLSTGSVRVRRGGHSLIVPAGDLVPGDIVILDAGDVIAADMRALEAANLACDESALTGESVPVSKSSRLVALETVLPERTSMLYKGCAVTRGTGEALVVATGMQTELGRITHLVEQSEPERSPLEKQLQRLSRDLIWITLGVVSAVAVAGIAAGGDLTLMIETSVALAVAAIPEGLPIVATLALARGMLRMARHNALMRRLSDVETLGATTVILTDKTGTLTENRMQVDRIVTDAGEVVFDRATQSFQRGDGVSVVAQEGVLSRLLRNAALCTNASIDEDGSGGIGDPMEVALLEAAMVGGYRRQTLLYRYPEVVEHAFEDATRMMATVHRAGDHYLIAVKGAPEAVLDRVRYLDDHDGTEPLIEESAQGWRERCDHLAARGLRLLAVAGKRADKADDDPYSDLTLHGIVALRDPPRPDVAKALADARSAGIDVIMVTGDHPRTAKSISESIGLAADDAEIMHGGDLRPLNELTTMERDSLRHVRLFSRVSPEQKLDLVSVHQESGEVVAMTGDGVNDAPALKKADIGIAMGRRGTEVAREAADMVLRDDAFPTIIDAVREGRIIFTNIRRFTTYLLSCNLSEVMVVGLAVAAGASLPLLPLQILFLNLVTDVFPALALGTIEADSDVLARPPRLPKEPILSKRQWRAIVIHGIVISTVTLTAFVTASLYFGLSGDELTTMSFFTLALAQLFHVFNMRNWRESALFNQLTRNSYIWLAVALCVVILGVAAFEPNLGRVLRITSLPGEAWATVLALSLVPVLLRGAAAATVRQYRRYIVRDI